MSGYWIVRTTTTENAEAAEQYGILWGKVADRYNARTVAGRGASETVEGDNKPRNLIIKFPSYQDALDCYNDPDYTAAAEIARKAYDRDLVIVEGD